jgi:hypothetical protein
MIFMLKFQPDGRPVLMLLAFGVRHHPQGSQRPLSFPRLSIGGTSRYRISEVEAWLRKHYGSPSETP